MITSIPVIDVFTGTGRLGEGFSILECAEGRQIFKIGVSVEKEASAHDTLELRCFFRQFPHNPVPDNYYLFLRENISNGELSRRHSDQASAA